MLHSILADSPQYFWLPKRASTVAGSVDDMFNVILWITIFFTALVTVMMVAFVIKFRHKPGVQRDTRPGHSTALEISWTVIPTIIVGFLYYYGFKEYMNLAVEPPNAYEITANAQMWNWSFTYPNGHVDSELHVPINTPVRVVLQSADVIHSLFIPAFRVKKDVVPGRFNRLWFEANQKGTYDIFCAGYCGTNHSTMLSKAVVHDPADFRAWLERASNPFTDKSPIQVGMDLYRQRGCAQCHTVDGGPGIGPSWKDLFGSTQKFTDGTSAVADEQYIHHFVYYPQEKIPVGFQPVMPSQMGKLSEVEIDAVISYMKSISANFKGDLSEFRVVNPNFGKKGASGTAAPSAGPTTAPSAGATTAPSAGGNAATAPATQLAQ